MLITGPSERIFIDSVLPGDKSIAHRAAILAAISKSHCTLRNFSTGQDCRQTLTVLGGLGVPIHQEGTEVNIEGVSLQGLCAPVAPLDCGNSGTTTRLLAGVLAGQPFKSSLHGDESLSGRPMRRITDPLERMGASIKLTGSDHLPMTIDGRSLHGIDYEIPVPSAQIKTGILLAGLFAQGVTRVRDSFGTRDHTERLLPNLFYENGWLCISGGSSFSFKSMTIPGDFSSAAFLTAAAILIPGSEVVLRRVGLNPTRVAFLDLLREAGANISVDHFTDAAEPFGDLVVRGTHVPLRSVTVDGSIVPRLIDEIPILAIVGTQMENGLEIRGAGELRIKESDRIRCLVDNLRAMGGKIEEYEDGFLIHPCKLKGGAIGTRGDHRIALAFSVAALIADGETTIDNEQCIAVSFPEFYELTGIAQTQFA